MHCWHCWGAFINVSSECERRRQQRSPRADCCRASHPSSELGQCSHRSVAGARGRPVMLWSPRRNRRNRRDRDRDRRDRRDRDRQHSGVCGSVQLGQQDRPDSQSRTSHDEDPAPHDVHRSSSSVVVVVTTWPSVLVGVGCVGGAAGGRCSGGRGCRRRCARRGFWCRGVSSAGRSRVVTATRVGTVGAHQSASAVVAGEGCVWLLAAGAGAGGEVVFAAGPRWSAVRAIVG